MHLPGIVSATGEGLLTHARQFQHSPRNLPLPVDRLDREHAGRPVLQGSIQVDVEGLSLDRSYFGYGAILPPVLREAGETLQ